MEDNSALKEFISEACKIIDMLAELCGFDKGIGKAVRMELVKFMIYISASDGSIECEEVDTIADICGVTLDAGELEQFIDKNKSFLTEFETTVPIAFQMIVEMDNKANMAGRSNNAGEAVLLIYRSLGETQMMSDAGRMYSEECNINTYIDMLVDYRNKHIKVDKGETTSAMKNEGTSSGSSTSKNGVEAPRKR